MDKDSVAKFLGVSVQLLAAVGLGGIIYVLIAQNSLDFAMFASIAMLGASTVLLMALILLLGGSHLRLAVTRFLPSLFFVLIPAAILLGFLLIQELAPSKSGGFDFGFDGFEPVPIPTVGAGRPAYMTLTASPGQLTCGEKSTILGTVTDQENRKVADGMTAKLVTNLGGTLAARETEGVTARSVTYGGVFVAYLITSTAHVGPYEVVAHVEPGVVRQQVEPGVARDYQLPSITAQVTVVCSLPAGP